MRIWTQSIYNTIHELKHTKFVGSDGIPIKWLKCNESMLSKPLNRIINTWIVIPIFKKGDRAEYNT